VSLHALLTFPDKLENSVLELEKRRITKDEGAKAEKAMKALDIKPVESVKSEDVDFVVSAGHPVWSCMARSPISW
jgi:hypothetical protein